MHPHLVQEEIERKHSFVSVSKRDYKKLQVNQKTQRCKSLQRLISDLFDQVSFLALEKEEC